MVVGETTGPAKIVLIPGDRAVITPSSETSITDKLLILSWDIRRGNIDTLKLGERALYAKSAKALSFACW